MKKSIFIILTTLSIQLIPPSHRSAWAVEIANGFRGPASLDLSGDAPISIPGKKLRCEGGIAIQYAKIDGQTGRPFICMVKFLTTEARIANIFEISGDKMEILNVPGESDGCVRSDLQALTLAFRANNLRGSAIHFHEATLRVDKPLFSELIEIKSSAQIGAKGRTKSLTTRGQLVLPIESNSAPIRSVQFNVSCNIL